MLDYLIYIFLLAGVVLSIIGGKLTSMGTITGGIIGLLIFKGAGYTGVAMLALFFILGSVATGWKSKKKQQLGMAEPDKGRRTAGQVIANGGVAALFGGMAWIFPQQASLLQLMMAGSFAAATADTLASELGSLYGGSFYDVITFKKVQPGPDGVVSLAGTLIGAAGAGLIAVIYALGFGFSGFVWVIVAAGAIGNLFDSVLGATFERRHQLGNNMVNFFNTATGAAVCLLLYRFIK